MVALAFAGAGFVTAIHGLAAEALPDLRVVHVASRSSRSARRRAAQTGGIACDYDELPGGADVVVVATPPALHRREAERAVGGSAVALVEAPLAATLDDADRLVAAADRGGRVGYAENLVHSPAVVEALGACRRLGSLTHLEVRFAQGRPDWGDHLEPSWGGGALFDLGVHAVTLALLAAAPARVTGVEAQLLVGGGLELDDDATVTLAFDSGLRAAVRATWRAPAPTWEAQAASPAGAVRLELVPHPSVELNGVPIALPDAPTRTGVAAAPPPRVRRPARSIDRRHRGRAAADTRATSRSPRVGHRVRRVRVGSDRPRGTGSVHGPARPYPAPTVAGPVDEPR